MQAKCPQVAIIVLNWNRWQDTVECLASLYQIDYPNYLVIIVDNGSQNESVRMLREYAQGITRANAGLCEHRAPDTSKVLIECKKDSVSLMDIADKSWLAAPSSRKMLIIKNERNEGFAEGSNTGIRAALTGELDYALLLNNDTVVDKRFLSELVQVAEDNRKAGFVGPKVYYSNYNGRTDVINFTGGKLDVLRGRTHHIGCNEIDVGQFDDITTVDYVEGSCMLVRKDVIGEVGMLNPLYSSYWEDVDWCIRAKKRG
jgi:GT2 family glycosyltransferase